MTKTETIQTLDAENPAMSNRKIAELAGCSRRLVRMIRNTSESFEKRMPKILIFDIETAPLEVYAWHLWKNVITPNMIIKDRSIKQSLRGLLSTKIYRICYKKRYFKRCGVYRK